MSGLAALASALCQDARVGLATRGDTWAWEPNSRTLIVPERAVERHGESVCAGIVAHEIGHAFLSRYLGFVEPLEGDTLLRLALNALEDPRVELWMMDRYPGVGPWLRSAHAQAGDAIPWLPTLQLLMGFVHDGWRFGPRRGPEEPTDAPWLERLHPEVTSLLEATRAQRREYTVGRLPSTELDEAPVDALARHEIEVRPFLAGALREAPVTRREAWVRVLARTAFCEARDGALAAVRGLFDADVFRLARGFVERGFAGRDLAELERRLAEPCGTAALVALFEEGGRRERDPSAEQLDVARRVLGAWLDRTLDDRTASGGGGLGVDVPAAGSTPCGESPEASSPGAGGTPPPARDEDERYAAALRELGADVDRLVARLEEVLRPRRRLGRRRGYASGQRLTLARAMAFEADRRRPVDFWERTTAPDRRHAAFLLLVDLSGSMRGDKVERAVAATALFAETLTRLQVPFAVIGFQDECIPVCDFDAPFDATARAAIASLVDEPDGARPDGHNVPAFNDDGPCLRAAAARLLERPEADRVLVALSDGAPAGRRSGDVELRQAIADLAPEIALVGIGVGDDTEHVSDFYPEALASVPLDELAERVGAVIAARLLAA